MSQGEILSYRGGNCRPRVALFWANIGWVEAEPLTLGTRGFSRVRREFSVLAKAARKTVRAGHYKDLTETGNRVRKVFGTQGRAHFP